MKKYPNTSIFNLITQKEGNTEKLIFIYIKPVSDFYTSENIHWYPQKGNKGEASFIWEKLSIKQWVPERRRRIYCLIFSNYVGGEKYVLFRSQRNDVLYFDWHSWPPLLKKFLSRFLK